MTLLELLVKELPNRGGWPEDVWHLTQDSDGKVNGYGYSEPYLNINYWNSEGFIRYLFDGERMFLCEDYATAIITREQYEAALAAAQQPVWDGEGLPPVGCECEYETIKGNWRKCRVMYIGEKCNIIRTDEWGEVSCGLSVKFRPILTEADRKRDIAVGAMEKSWEAATDKPAYDFEIIYEAIAAGKIPGVELSK